MLTCSISNPPTLNTYGCGCIGVCVGAGVCWSVWVCGCVGVRVCGCVGVLCVGVLGYCVWVCWGMCGCVGVLGVGVLGYVCVGVLGYVCVGVLVCYTCVCCYT